MNVPYGPPPDQRQGENAAAGSGDQPPYHQTRQNMSFEQPSPNPGAQQQAYGQQPYGQQQWAQPDYYAPPPPQWAQSGPYGPPPQQPGFPPPYGPQFHAQQPPPSPPPNSQPGENGFETMFNDMADQNGLGMLKGMFNFQDGDFWKGALVGAAVVMLVTNENLRGSILSSLAKSTDAMKSGFSGNNATTPEPEGTEETDQTQSENQ